MGIESFGFHCKNPSVQLFSTQQEGRYLTVHQNT